MILNRFIVLFIIFFLFSCTKEKKKMVDQDGVKQMQYFDKNGNIYKIDNYKKDSVYSTTYLFNKKDSTTYVKDTLISVIDEKEDNFFLSKNYNKKNKVLLSMGTLLDLGMKGRSSDFLPVGAWVFFDKGKLSNYYHFYLTESGDLLLTQIIKYNKDESIDLTQSNYLKVTKEGDEIFVTLHSCCFDAHDLIINGDRIKSISKNRWKVSSKYLLEDNSITGYVLLGSKKEYPFLSSKAIGEVPKLKQSDTMYFYETFKPK